MGEEERDSFSSGGMPDTFADLEEEPLVPRRARQNSRHNPCAIGPLTYDIMFGFEVSAPVRRRVNGDAREDERLHCIRENLEGKVGAAHALWRHLYPAAVKCV